ncbi:hypothetical protein TIFTF001_009766 [Ficus carica]|uniref:Uncharacterized protein n=1 Tax=Ficus carica TaxID=3494 RepID=A0AA88CZ85_FICCA|nr:hypothetical protein TIFTF001_009766 [Ficus carica]
MPFRPQVLARRRPEKQRVQGNVHPTTCQDSRIFRPGANMLPRPVEDRGAPLDWQRFFKWVRVLPLAADLSKIWAGQPRRDRPQSPAPRPRGGTPRRGLPARPVHLVGAAMWRPTAPTRPGRISTPANGFVPGGHASTT